ncbi:FtsQ-type POTRA domain-containing protein [Amycolatopsis sp. PS_44_ISF1]|uniref:cell division protein FtsQ/DivIB n=1 Tax=Amycolatopsis sp. PS_44_ISF1 TaxID=2974917 RepID=UPI0028E00846|nr:FtsQ-type POTRA domain-containing protein [Amycolatopsis sp. PS_44_ISF1]MDT8914867.1 FtsQ-type POTRA domain-containing protein [Amycolatopsis sp. PS_44_ISF1]
MSPTREHRRSPEPEQGERDRAALARERRGRRSEAERRRTRSSRATRPAAASSASAVRARPSRRTEIRRRWVALLSVLTVVAAVYFLFFSSVLGVHEVAVQGAKQVSADQIRATAAVPAGQPMLRVDADEIRDRVAAMSGVATVDVSRSWPNTVEIAVTERTAIAFFDSGPGGDGIHLVDGGGVVFKTVRDRPAGLPELKLPKVSVDDPVTRAVTAVLGVIPQAMLKQVTTATAQTPASVEFTLAGGQTVRWGNAEKTDRKAKVLAALLTQPGKVYDVSAPELPTISS